MATIRQLLDQLRIDLDDKATGDERELWTDNELVSYINRALGEACVRAKLIRDSDTSSICRIVLRSGVAKYSLDKRILGLRKVYVDGSPCIITPTNSDVLDDTEPRWRQETGDIPSWYIADLDACWIQFTPIPTVVNTLTLSVWRLPIEDLTLDKPDQEPEINQVHHYNLLDYAKYLAYIRHDGDSHNPEMSSHHEAMFARNFGQRRSAEVVEILRNERHLRTKAHFR